MTQPFFLASPPAGVALQVSVMLFAVGELQQVFRLRRGVRSKLGDEVIFRVAFFAGILSLAACGALLPAATIAGPAIFVAGIVIGWLGLLLRWWSFLVLGRYFTTTVKVSPDQPIIDRGPYRYLRHPGYTGLVLAFLGGGLALGNWVGAIAVTVIVGAALSYRLLREERALIAARGSAYLEYARGRKRLIPFVW